MTKAEFFELRDRVVELLRNVERRVDVLEPVELPDGVCECCGGGSEMGYLVMFRSKPSLNELFYRVCPDCKSVMEFGRLPDGSLEDAVEEPPPLSEITGTHSSS